MNQQLFVVEEFEASYGEIRVICNRNGNAFTLGAPLHQLEKWLSANDKMSFETNHSDRGGSHVQYSGKMPIENYLELKPEIVHQDLYEFLNAEVIKQAV